MRTWYFVCLAPLVATACGGNVASSSASNNDNITEPQPGNPPATLPERTVAGSFDLTFSEVTAAPRFAGYDGPSSIVPTQGQNARLDVASDSATSVVLTPRWGAPVTLGAAATAGNLSVATQADPSSPESRDELATFGVLDGSTGIQVTDRWSSFSFGRKSDGGFDGTFTARGDEQQLQGDVFYESTLTAKGTIALDSTAPEVRTDTMPAYGLLPWDPMHVHFAEPPTIAQDRILSFAPGVVAPNTTTLDPQILLTSWDVDNTAIAAASFEDLAGNSSKPTSLPLTYVNVGSAKPAFTFDDASVSPAIYGSASGLITPLEADAVCESGGCMKVGSISRYRCNTEAAGFAGVLQQNPAASTLHVRYRIFVGIDPAEAHAPSLRSDAALLAIETAAPGVLPTTTNLALDVADLKTVSATFGFTHATDWASLDIPVATASQAGFSIQTTNRACGGGIPNDDDVVVLIDSITID